MSKERVAKIVARAKQKAIFDEDPVQGYELFDCDSLLDADYFDEDSSDESEVASSPESLISKTKMNQMKRKPRAVRKTTMENHKFSKVKGKNLIKKFESQQALRELTNTQARDTVSLQKHLDAALKLPQKPDESKENTASHISKSCSQSDFGSSSSSLPGLKFKDLAQMQNLLQVPDAVILSPKITDDVSKPPQKPNESEESTDSLFSKPRPQSDFGASSSSLTGLRCQDVAQMQDSKISAGSDNMAQISQVRPASPSTTSVQSSGSKRKADDSIVSAGTSDTNKDPNHLTSELVENPHKKSPSNESNSVASGAQSQNGLNFSNEQFKHPQRLSNSETLKDNLDSFFLSPECSHWDSGIGSPSSNRQKSSNFVTSTPRNVSGSKSNVVGQIEVSETCNELEMTELGDTENTVDRIPVHGTSRAETPSVLSVGIERKGDDSTGATDADYDPTALSSDWIESQLLMPSQNKLIINWYNKNQSLSMSKRNDLVRIIIGNELAEDPDKHISPGRFQAIASAICLRFPSEEVDTYYVPFFRDESGKKYNARGKLYDKYTNMRRDFRTEGLIAARGENRSENSNDSEDEGGSHLVVSEEVKNAESWLQNHMEPKEELIERFKQTCRYRVVNFQNSGEKDIYKYLCIYPVLRLTKGYLLIDQDFDVLYPGLGNSLFNKWNDLQKNLLDYGKKNRSKKHFVLTLKSLDINLDCTDDKWLTIYALTLLVAAAPVLTATKKWRPSTIEARDAFLLQATTEKEALAKIERRNKTLLDKGFKIPPVAVVVGKAPGAHKCFVNLQDITYECPSALKAIDICMKLFILLKLNVPPESRLAWLFLKAYVYKSPSTHLLTYPSLKTLRNDLNFT